MNPTLLERRNVSRKTPGDGMVEITKPVAQRLMKLNREFDLTTPTGHGRVALTSMPCTCRGADNPHEHWFLRSDLFKTLMPGAEIELTLIGTRIEIRLPDR
jgi:hypothetical protein